MNLKSTNMKGALALSLALAFGTIQLVAQTQFPDLLWERGGNTRPAYELVPLSNNRLLVGSFDGSARVWDLTTRTTTLTLITTRFLGGRAMAVTPNEQLLVTGDADGWVRCWSLESGRLLYTLGRTRGRVNDVACSPQGDWVVVGDSSGIVRRWDLNSRQLLDTLTLPSPVRGLVVSPDGLTLIATTSLPEEKENPSAPNPARIINIPGLAIRATIDGIPPNSPGNSPIYEVAYINNETVRMATFSAILTVNASTGQILNRREVDYSIAGGPEFLVVENDTSVITGGVLFAGLRRYRDGVATADTIVEFGRQLAALAVDKQGRRLFMATQASDIQVWNLQDDTFMFDLEGMTGYLRRAAWSQHGKDIATASSGSDRVRVITVDDGTTAQVISNPPWGFASVASMAFDNTGTSLFFTPTGNDGIRRLRRFNMSTSLMDTTFVQPATSVAVSRTTNVVFAFSRDSLFLFESSNSQRVLATSIDDACIAWTSTSMRNGNVLLSCADSSIRVFDGATGDFLRFQAVSAPAVDVLIPASKPGNEDVIVLLQYGRTEPDAIDAVIVDAENLQEIRTIPNIGKPFVDGFLSNRVACSKSADYFAVGRDDGSIDIIDGSTNAVVKTLQTGGSPVTFLTVHPDTEAMVGGTADGRVVRLKNPWPSPTSFVESSSQPTTDDLMLADDVRWFLLDGRCIGYGAEQQPVGIRQPMVAVARFGARIVSRLVIAY